MPTLSFASVWRLGCAHQRECAVPMVDRLVFLRQLGAAFLQPDLVLAHPASRLEFLVDELKNIYSGSPAVYGASFGSIGLVVAVGATSILSAGRMAERWWGSRMRSGFLASCR
jgi:hypothetical protein